MKILKIFAILFYCIVFILLIKNIASSYSYKRPDPPPKEFSSEKTEVSDGRYDFSFISTRLSDVNWAPDSQRLVGVLVNNNDDHYLGSGDIHLWDLNGNQYLRISKDEGRFNTYPMWNPVKNQVLYTSYSLSDFNDMDIGYVDLDTGEYIGVAEEPYSAGYWFPDGKSLITSKFVKYNLKTGETEILLQDPEIPVAYTLLISPFGDEIVLEYDKQVFSLDLESHEFKKHPIHGKFIDLLDWSPDGKWIYYSDEDDNSNALINAYNIEKLCITDPLKFPKFFDGKKVSLRPWYGFDWSPDGKMLVIKAVLGGELHGIFFIDSNSSIIQDWLSSGECAE